MKESYQIAHELYARAVAQGARPDVCLCCGADIIGGLPACVELFAELGALRYTDPAYAAPTLYGVDAHALQHPEIHGKKNNAAHLLRLHWLFSRGEIARVGDIPRWWHDWLNDGDIPILEPPRHRGDLTVMDVAVAHCADDFARLMEAWARSVYAAWGEHHAWAERELRRLLP